MFSPGDTKIRLCALLELQGADRDLFNYYNVWDKCGIFYGGLVELIVNAMADLQKPFIEWEWH